MAKIITISCDKCGRNIVIDSEAYPGFEVSFSQPKAKYPITKYYDLCCECASEIIKELT